MRHHDRARDGEAEAGTRPRRTRGAVETFEHPRSLVPRNAGAVVGDSAADGAGARGGFDLDVAPTGCITERVVEQVVEDALELVVSVSDDQSMQRANIDADAALRRAHGKANGRRVEQRAEIDL